MNRYTIIFCLVLLPLCNAQLPYSEDVLAGMPERIRLWRQMESYAAKAGQSHVTPAIGPTFEGKIGYPPPDLIRRPVVRREKSGEDSVASYYRLWVEVAPQLETYGLYIVPKSNPGRAPLVIAIHGGGGFPELAAYYHDSRYRDMVRGAVERGYVVFVPHLIFYPYHDRDHGTSIPENVRAVLDEKLQRRGTSLMAVEVAKIIRSLDVILTWPEVDASRVAMIGLSWGGAYTQYVAALDPRIRVAVSSCSFQGDLPAKPGFGTHGYATTAELVRMISPRPLQLQFGDHDPHNPIDKVRRGLAGVDVPFDLAVFPGDHEFCGELAWAFLKRHL